MRIFGVSLMTIALLVVAYVVGVKFPGPGSAVLSKVGL